MKLTTLNQCHPDFKSDYLLRIRQELLVFLETILANGTLTYIRTKYQTTIKQL